MPIQLDSVQLLPLTPSLNPGRAISLACSPLRVVSPTLTHPGPSPCILSPHLGFVEACWPWTGANCSGSLVPWRSSSLTSWECMPCLAYSVGVRSCWWHIWRQSAGYGGAEAPGAGRVQFLGNTIPLSIRPGHSPYLTLPGPGVYSGPFSPQV